MPNCELLYIYLDEAGDAVCPGNTDFFVISAVAFLTEAQSTAAVNAIELLRNGWGTLTNNEFKFARLSSPQKVNFFEAVADLEFKHCSCVSQKQNFNSQWKNKYFVYEKVIQGTMAYLIPWLRKRDEAQQNPLRIRVFFDEHTDGKYIALVKAEFKKLRSKNGSAMLSAFSQIQSSSHRLIQLADLLCGASRWDSNDFRKYVSAQCLGRQILPGN